jgi:phenylpyruvate tautomerase PptA (4-oxalocrotonate tautomerase family)
VPLVQVFTPTGAVSKETRDEISGELLAEVMRAEGAPYNAAAKEISWLLWHEVDAWWVGDDRVSDAGPPRYLVRVAVPAASMDSDAKRAEIVQRATAVMAKSEDDPSRLEREPAAWVLIDEVPEGNWGALGQVVRYNDIRGFIGTAAS